MRHATPEDLHHVKGLLEKLHKLPQLRERQPGYFSRGSRAFLHFHADGADIYVDVKLQGEFERVKVTSRKEQDDLLARVAGSLQSTE